MSYMLSKQRFSQERKMEIVALIKDALDMNEAGKVPIKKLSTKVIRPSFGYFHKILKIELFVSWK